MNVFSNTQPFRWYIALIALASMLASSAVAASDVIRSTNLPSVTELITNCPPINNLIFRYKFGKNVELWQFRCQSNGFFARVSKANSFQGKFTLQDTECGRWNNDYWFYSYTPPPAKGAPPVPPVLDKYHLSSNDLNSIAYQSVKRYLLTRLRLFTSLGIAGDNAPGLLSVKNKSKVVYNSSRQKMVVIARLTYSNALPTLATLKIITPDGKAHVQHISYHYKPEIAGGHIPAYIKGLGFSIKVRDISFGQADNPLPKDYFMPPKQLLAMRGMRTEIHSNFVEYVFARDGHLIGRHNDSHASRILNSQMAKKALQSGYPQDQVEPMLHPEGRRFYIISLFGISAVVLITVIIRLRKKG